MSTNYSREDCDALLQALKLFIDGPLHVAERQAYDASWAHLCGREDELPDEMLRVSEELMLEWFLCDHELAPGVTALDVFVQATALPPRLLAAASAMRQSTMSLYEVADVVSGRSVTLHDIAHGELVTVRDELLPRALEPGDWLAARAFSARERPMLARGLFEIPRLLQRFSLFRLDCARKDPLRPRLTSRFQASVPPLLHEVWISAVLDPNPALLRDAFNKPIVIVERYYDVLDAMALRSALDACAGLRADRDRWCCQTSAVGSEVHDMATLQLRGDTLVVEARSDACVEHAVHMLRAAAAPYLRYRATAHQGVARGRPVHEPPGAAFERLRVLALDRAHEARWAHAQLPPPVAHERFAQLVPGFASLVRKVVDAVRQQRDFQPGQTLIDRAGCRAFLDVARFLRRERPGPTEASPHDGDWLSQIELAVNFALHGSAVFWVEPALAYHASKRTIRPADLNSRAPAAACAFVFSDPYTFELGEQLLTRRSRHQRSSIRLVTAYLTLRNLGRAHTWEVCFAFDVSAGVPILIRHGPIRVDAAARSTHEAGAPPSQDDDADPLRPLVRAVVHAAVHASHAHYPPEVRTAEALLAAHPEQGDVGEFTSERVQLLRARSHESHA